VYCQAGRTTCLEINRREYFPPEQVLQEAKSKIIECAQVGRMIDYLTLVPDGEPALDLNLGRLIGLLKETGIPVAVIGTTAVHPLREKALQKMVARAEADWDVVETLIADGKIKRILYREEWFYIRG
jgi:wyosine [tRNA(Phe)-imidazoG37] synthetase (radical SAM superfamily)